MTHGAVVMDNAQRAAATLDSDQRPNSDQPRTTADQPRPTADQPPWARTEPVAEGLGPALLPVMPFGRAGNSRTKPTGDQATKLPRINKP